MDSYEMLLVFITVITLLLQCYVFFIVQFKSPLCMQSYRYYLNIVIIYDMLFSVFFGIILQPYPINLSVLVGIRGVAYYFGYRGIYAVVSLN